MAKISSVAVFCGAQPGNRPVFVAAAQELGRGLAAAGIRLVFGGGRIGLMGAVADAALGAGGEVLGVIPEFLKIQEVAHAGVAELIVTDTMHTRKRQMFDMVEAFVTMPGGLGTYDETIEIITWRQLKLHDKPILLCNVEGSAEPLVAALEGAIAMGFAKPEIRRLYEVVEGVPAVLARLAELQAITGGASDLT